MVNDLGEMAVFRQYLNGAGRRGLSDMTLALPAVGRCIWMDKLLLIETLRGKKRKKKEQRKKEPGTWVINRKSPGLKRTFRMCSLT